MTALNQHGMKLQSLLPDPIQDPQGYNANYERAIDFNSRLGAVGKVLAASKYEEACAIYDALANEYAVNLAEQRVRPLSALEAESSTKPSTSCDLAEAARRSVWLAESFKKHAETERLERGAWQVFGKETEQIGLLMQQDPNGACTVIDGVAAKYGLKRQL